MTFYRGSWVDAMSDSAFCAILTPLFHIQLYFKLTKNSLVWVSQSVTFLSKIKLKTSLISQQAITVFFLVYVDDFIK